MGRFSSSIPEAGKSLTAANLAIAMAQSGTSTLLVDADLRRPTIHQLFGLTTRVGLTSALTRMDDWSSMLSAGPVENLTIMPSGPLPPNPSELLSSAAMRRLIALTADRYDMVILDTPPVVAFTDGVALSQAVDGTLLVVRANFASRKVDIKAKELLVQVHARILGIVFNGLPADDAAMASYYYGYGEHP
ncbi:MAG: CpsD/CapB family tyrosine-protein kinase [Thermaerobacter sp.]|nr:CpsD/CapB family tyrosine-protein kinase [Thermaerobacter sp.]